MGGREFLEREAASDFDLARLVEANWPADSADRVVSEGLLDRQELTSSPGDRRPIDLLPTDNGARLVELILRRIEYGVYG